MTDHEFEAQLAAVLRAMARDGRRPFDAAALSRDVDRPRPGLIQRITGATTFGRRGSMSSRRRIVSVCVGVALVALIAVVASRPPGDQDRVGTPTRSDGRSVAPAPSATAPVSAASPATPSGRLAYGDDRQIWIADLDGDPPAAVVDRAIVGGPPQVLAWDRTGRRLAAFGDGGAVAIIDRESLGAQTAAMPQTIGQTDLSWSADGAEVAVMGIGPDSLAWLRIVDAATMTVRTVPLPDRLGYEFEERAMAWSPDGTWIAFTGCRACAYRKATTGDLYVVHPDGSSLRQLTQGSYDYAPAWIDSSTITFARHEATDVVMAVGVDGSGLRRLDPSSGPSGWNTGITVSPNRTALAFAPRGTGTVVVVDVAGIQADRILRPDVDTVDDTVWVLGWSPDGQSLVVVDETRGLAFIDPSTGSVDSRSADLWLGRTDVGPVATTLDR
jgi:hypothetical protein